METTKVKVIGYANLNSFNSTSEVTEEHMRSFFEGENSDGIGEIIDVVIDRYKDEIPCSQRDGWNKVVEACKNNQVSLIVVPAIAMLSVSPIDVLRIAREFKDAYHVDFYFMLEEIGTENDDDIVGLHVQTKLWEEKERQIKTERSMRKLFRRVTGKDDRPSAVPVYVDDEQYAKLEKVSHAYGLSTREVISALFTFAIVPQNKPAMEQHIFGIDPPKPLRGGARKH